MRSLISTSPQISVFGLLGHFFTVVVPIQAGSMPQRIASETVGTEPPQAISQNLAVCPLHHTLLPDRPFGDLHGERPPPQLR